MLGSYKKGEMMEKVRPVYKKMLIAAIVIFVIGTAVALSDIYSKIGAIEHSFICRTPGCPHGIKITK